MCARDMRPPSKTPGGRGQDGPRAGTRAEAPRTSAVVFAFSASTQSRSPLSRGGHRRAWATKGPTTFLLPAQAYRRRTRAPRRHPRALRCPRRRPPPRADIGGRRGSPFVVGFGRRELVLLPSSTGSETSMTSGSSTRGEADASRCRGARSVGSPVLSWGGRPGRPRGRVRCAPSRAPEPTGPGRRTLRGRTGAATSPRRRPARAPLPPLRARHGHPRVRPARVTNVDDNGAEVRARRRPSVPGSWGRVARGRGCRSSLAARPGPNDVGARSAVEPALYDPHDLEVSGARRSHRSVRAAAGRPVRAGSQAVFAPSPSLAAPCARSRRPARPTTG